MPNYTAQDIVTFAGQQKPLEVAAAFDELIGQKLQKSIQDRKIELASAIFNGSTDPELIQQLKANADVKAEEPTEDESEEEASDEEDLDDVDLDITDEDLLNLSDEELEELGLEDWNFDDDTESETDSESQEDNGDENT